jgi:SWI/SNF-related matrix-associated actin-dependent regulator 1 of chromatin subfamily A
MDNEKIEIAELLRVAASALAGVCDGARKRDDVGFSASDTSYGRAIAATPAEHWTEEDLVAVSDMLGHYRGQLMAYGVDWSALPRVTRTVTVDRHSNYESFKTRAAAAERTRVRAAYAAGTMSRIQVRMAADYLAWVDRRTVCFVSPKNDTLIAAIKALPGRRRWNGEARQWEAELSADNAKSLPAIFARFDFVVSDADLATIHASAQANPAAQAAPVAVGPDHVSIEGDRIVLRVPYNPEATMALKEALPGRRWNAQDKVWTAPATAEAAKAVEALAARFGWRLGASAKPLWALRVEADRFRAASKAADADVALTGLAPGAVPYAYQKAGVAYAQEKRQVLIADEMGLGKTPQALITVAQLDAWPCLVVVPKAVLRQWARETTKFLAGRTASIVGLKGTAKRLAKHGLVAGMGGDVVVVNYDQLSKLVTKIDVTKPGDAKKKYEWHLTTEIQAHGFKSLVVDESHMVKQAKADRTQRVKALAKMSGLECTLLLTGTPVLNRPIELVSQLDILGQLVAFGGFMPFAKRYCAAHETKYGWDMTGSSNLDELNRLLRERCMIRREKADVLAELPALRRTVVPVEVDDPRAYERAMNDIVAWMAANRGSLPSEAAYRAEMLVRVEGLRQLAAQGKYANGVAWVQEWLEAAEGQKLVLFAHHRNIQERLLADLAEYGAVSISGGDADAARDAAVQRFWADPTCRVIVCSLKAASVGLNLQAASNVAFFEFGWHAADMDQAEARCHRIGVQGAVTAYWLVGEDTFDEDMVALIEDKRAVAHAAVSGGEVAPQTDVVSWFERLAARKGAMD